MKKSKQTICTSLRIHTPVDDPKTYTEAAVKRWLEQQLKNCPFGTVLIGDVVDMMHPD